MTSRDPSATSIPESTYEVLAPLGEGSMGVVYKVRDRRNGQVLALKTLRHPSAEDLYRLKQEFRALAGIVHPNLVELHDLEVEEGRAWFTMEWVDGIDFVSALRGPRPEANGAGERIRAAFSGLCAGLSALHARSKLHRDIKPANVLVERDGRVVLLDFGLVAAMQADTTVATTGWMVGTLAYMAPELTRGVPATPASDWYGAGVVLYQALAGRLPFDTRRLALRRPDDRPPHPCDLDPSADRALSDLAMDLLVSDPAERPAEEEIRSRIEAPAATLPGSGAAASPLVGRADELGRLHEAFEASRRGAVSIHVEGSSGIGKSALIAHFAADLAARGEALVLRSRCHPHESVRYAAVDGIVDELSRYLVEQPAERLDSIAPRQRAALLQVFPVLGRVPFPDVLASPSLAGVDPLEVRRRAFGALCELLGRLSERLPLVLWVDDLQWGDLDSATLLRELLHGPDAPPALVVLSYRTQDRDQSALIQQLLAEEGEETARRVRLEPLDPSAASELVQALTVGEAELVAQVADDLREQAAGSPFVLGELVRALRERAREGARGSSLRELRLGAIVQERTGRLSTEARELLELVALSGVPLSRSIALGAAGLAGEGRRTASLLRQDFLLRSSPVDGGEGLEIYHDRIRESVVAGIPAERRIGLHRRLLASLEGQAGVSPERLYLHAFEGGEPERAGDFAIEAGDQAAETLAFQQAADYYQRALDAREWEPERAQGLRRRRADALVNAGRCEEAAPLYLLAADGASPAEGREARRLAAEQYMVSGLTEEGLSVLRPLLSELGLHYPATPASALSSTLLRLAQLRIRGIGYRDVAEEALPALERARMDVCFSAARGLVMTDTVRAAYLPLVGLLLSLRTGEPHRVGRHLAMVAGAVLAPFGGSLGRFGARLLDESRAIAERTGDPYVAASVALAEGQIGILTGDWRRAVSESEEALAILREHCRGVSWERNVAHAAELRGLEELGRFEEGHERALRMAAEAEERGDRYGAVVAALMLGVTYIGREETDLARAQLRRALERWPQDAYLMQHFYALRVEVHADLCDGDAESAHQRLEAAWPQIKRSGFLRVSAPRIDALLMRARVEGRRVATPVGQRRFQGLVRELRGQGRADASAHADLLDKSSTGAAVGAAEFERLGMLLFARLAMGRAPSPGSRGWAHAALPPSQLIDAA